RVRETIAPPCAPWSAVPHGMVAPGDRRTPMAFVGFGRYNRLMDEAALTLYKLRVFCEIVERQSFTQAAERLFTTQPALSVHVRSLERLFGTRLVYREGRRSLPTEAGNAVYRYARGVLQDTEHT